MMCPNLKTIGKCPVTIILSGRQTTLVEFGMKEFFPPSYREEVKGQRVRAPVLGQEVGVGKEAQCPERLQAREEGKGPVNRRGHQLLQKSNLDVFFFFQREKRAV